MTSPSAVSHAGTVFRARILRALGWALEISVGLVVVGSVFAFGAVHEWAYVPLWWAAAGSSLLLGARAGVIRSLRARLGLERIAFHSSGRWLVVGDERSPYGGGRGASFDLAAPLLPRGPLLWPGLAFLIFGFVQLVPLPPALVWRPADLIPRSAQWTPLSLSPADSLRGLVFVLTALVFHSAAVAVLSHRGARERLRLLVAALGLGLTIVAFAQMASGIPLIYGSFQPLDLAPGDARFFGPFVNRNHFAAYMVMLALMNLGTLDRGWRRFTRRVGAGANLRRRIVALQSAQGTGLLYAIVPALVSVAGLVATTSRGGILAFLGGLALTVAMLRTRITLGAVFPLVLAALVLSWSGLDRVGVRFEHALGESVSRTSVWKSSLERSDGYWLLGSGLNTFETAMARSTAWALPPGATPWSDDEREVGLTPRLGYFVPEGTNEWFRELHNDYLQLFVETGIFGLAIAVWAIVCVIRRRLGDPWGLGALAGLLLHLVVEFAFQVPAIVVLFVTLAALPAVRVAGARSGLGGAVE